MSIFKEYMRWKKMPLHEQRKYMSARYSTPESSEFPLPDIVVNAINLVPKRYHAKMLKKIFTDGMVQATHYRRELADKIKSWAGVDVGQDGVFSPEARKKYPQLRDIEDDIASWWEYQDAEPDFLDDINAELRAQGKMPLLYGGPNGLMEYLEKGDWKRDPNNKDPLLRKDRYGKQGFGLSLPDDKSISGKYQNDGHHGYSYRFGLAEGDDGKPQGSFVPRLDLIYWDESLKTAKYLSDKMIEKISSDIAQNNNLDSEEIKWLKDKVANNEIDQDLGRKILNNELEFDDKWEAANKILNMKTRGSKRTEADEKMASQAFDSANPKMVATLKASAKMVLRHMLDVPSEQTGVSPSNAVQHDKKGIAPSSSLGNAFIQIAGGKTESLPDRNDPFWQNPAQKDAWAEKWASLMFPDKGAPPVRFHFGYDSSKDTRWGPLTPGKLIAGAKSKASGGAVGDAFRKAQEENTPLTTEFRGKQYSFNPSEVLDKNGTLRPFISKTAKHESPFVMGGSRRKQVDIEDLMSKGFEVEETENPNIAYAIKGDQKITLKQQNGKWFRDMTVDLGQLANQGWDLEPLGNEETESPSLLKATKDGEEKFLRRKLSWDDQGDREEKWYEVKKGTRSGLPILPGKLSLRPNTASDLSPRMAMEPEEGKQAFDDYVYNPEKYGERSMSLEGNPYPESIVKGIQGWQSPNTSGEKQKIKPQDMGDVAVEASAQLLKQMNSPYFYYGKFEPENRTRMFGTMESGIKKDLSELGLESDQADKLIELLRIATSKESRDVLPKDGVEMVEVPEDNNSTVFVSPEVFKAVRKNAIRWRKAIVRKAANNWFSKQVKNKERTNQGATGKDGEEMGWDPEANPDWKDDEVDYGDEFEKDFEYDDEGDFDSGGWDDEFDDDEAPRKRGHSHYDDDEDERRRSKENLPISDDDADAWLNQSRSHTRRQISQGMPVPFQGAKKPEFQKGQRLDRRIQLPTRKGQPIIKPPLADLNTPRPIKQKPLAGLDTFESTKLKSYHQWKEGPQEPAPLDTFGILKSYDRWIGETEVVFNPNAIKKDRTFNVWGSPPETGTIPQKSIDGDADTAKRDPTGKKGIKKYDRKK